MPEILKLKPEDEKILLPEALNWFYTQRTEIHSEVPLDELKDDDLDNYLHNDEKLEFNRCKDEISQGLISCSINNGGGSTSTALSTDLAVLSFEVNSLRPLHQIKVLLNKVYSRKREEQNRQAEEHNRQAEQAERERINRERAAELERKKREYEETRAIVWKALAPPINDAQVFLDQPGEYEKFIRAVNRAVEVYIEKPDGYLNDSRTLEYQWYLNEIQDKKEDLRLRQEAQAQAQGFGVRLNREIKEIGKQLSPKKEEPSELFKKWCSDNSENRFMGQSFADIFASYQGNTENWTEGYINTAEIKLRQSIPEEIHNFIVTKPSTAFFLLPQAHYSFHGVPCLDFNFGVFAVVTAIVLVQPGIKVFNGYSFKYLADLPEPKHLGFYQTIVLPRQYHFWQSVPLAIINALVKGNILPSGATILERNDGLTAYQVDNYDGATCLIPASLERYCRLLGSIEKFNEIKIITERTAEILKLAGPANTNPRKSNDMKTKVFLLFDQGKRPSDPEVKTLGIKAPTAYRYYQEWKKCKDGGDNHT